MIETRNQNPDPAPKTFEGSLVAKRTVLILVAAVALAIVGFLGYSTAFCKQSNQIISWTLVFAAFALIDLLKETPAYAAAALVIAVAGASLVARLPFRMTLARFICALFAVYLFVTVCTLLVHARGSCYLFEGM
jgi:hypothetical protein